MIAQVQWYQFTENPEIQTKDSRPEKLGTTSTDLIRLVYNMEWRKRETMAKFLPILYNEHLLI